MRTLRWVFVLGLSFPIAIGLTACGGGAADDFDDGSSDAPGFAATNEFDESQLPDAFPTNLIPPEYDSGNFMVLGTVSTAAFESAAPVGGTVAH